MAAKIKLNGRTVEVPRKAELIPEDKPNYELTWLEKTTLRIDKQLETAGILIKITPFVTQSIGGLMFKDWKTTATGIVGVAAVLLAQFGIIELSPETQVSIVAVATAVIGYFASDKSKGTPKV